MGRKALGLDIGVASVGWGVIDLDDSNFVDAGVRLFKENTPANNLKRRTARGGRRLKSRRVNRLSDLRAYLEEIEMIDSDFHYLQNPLRIRVKAINEKVSGSELATCLLHICKHRGNSMEVVEDDKDKVKDNETTKITLKENDKKIKEGLEVCEVQLERLIESGAYRGHANNFRTSQYIKEVKRILSHSDLLTEQQQKIIEIISRRRMYYEGPGSYKSPTKYGRFIYENGEIVEIDLIDKMRGKCTIYPDQLRAPKNSYSAELHNFLNDLNNLTVNNEKLSSQQKEEFLKIVDEKFNITPKGLAKLLNVPLEAISGFRIDKKNEPILTEFEGYKKIKTSIEDDKFVGVADVKKLVDDVTDILVVKKGIDERKEAIAKKYPMLNNFTLDKLANISGITKYHAFSFKALKLLNDEMLVSDMNQTQIIHTNGLLNKEGSIHKGYRNIRFDEEAILSPVAKQAHREAIKIVNQLRRKYGEFESVIIETTRAKNSDDEKAIINERQKYNEINNKKIVDLVGNSKIPGDVKLKVRLYMEQDGKCMYTGNALDLDLIMKDSTAYEVDHIIPISISLDDSITNKVLVLHSANQAKSNLTPYQAFKLNKFGDYTYNEFKARVLSLSANKNINNKKKDYLLFEEDITKYDVMAKFINRNLVDTSYANRIVMNTLQEYFKVNEIPTTVLTVKGKATAAFRSRIGLEKDREESYAHHAIDALIIVSIVKNKLLDKVIKNTILKDNQITFKDTGEIWDINKENNEYLENSYMSFIKKLHKQQITKYSWKVDRKPNRQIADETIYSTRVIGGEQRVIKKYKDIYDPKFDKLALDIQDGKFEKYLMFRNDKETFEKLVAIVKNHINEYGEIDSKSKDYINPFYNYYKENGPVTKYAKKNNGPAVVSMKYCEDKLGNHIDITHKYSIKDDKKIVMLQISPFRTDFYKCKDGVYRFVTIRYSNLKYYKNKGGFEIDREWYEQELIKKGIKNIDDFIFSLQRNDILRLVEKDSDTLYKFTATNNNDKNTIEVKPLSYYERKQIMKTIGKNTLLIKKYHCDVLGELREVKKESLKLFIECSSI